MVIWRQTILIVRKETRCRHIGYSFQLTTRVLLYAPSNRQDSTYHGLCYTRRGSLAGTRNSSMGSTHEGLIRRPIAPLANALTTELHLAPSLMIICRMYQDAACSNFWRHCRQEAGCNNRTYQVGENRSHAYCQLRLRPDLSTDRAHPVNGLTHACHTSCTLAFM